MSDIRYDLIHDEYVIIAPERLRRPDCFFIDADSRKPGRDDRGKCPFCPGNEKMTTKEIFSIRDSGEPDTPGWRTRVVPNLYKAVQIESPWRSEDAGLYEKWAGFGAHEVIIDTPEHKERMDGWSLQEYGDWLRTLRYRVMELRKDIRLVHMSIFKNHGHYGAATQSHPHTQLIALPVVPKIKRESLRHALYFYREHGRSRYATVIGKELHERERVVCESGRFVAICPFASAFPFEVAIYSLEERKISLSEFDDGDIEELSEILSEVFEALYLQLGNFDFNILFDIPPLQKNYATEEFFDDLPDIWRFSIRIVPRIYRMGGFELGSGMMINPVAPEEAAKLLRKDTKSR
jgi:UDPglucose--hexose-1-phosphate uridylyltransferase